MKQRDQVAMTRAESSAFLAAGRKMHLATINPDGTAHLVAMYYVLVNGEITFWTYRSSQKARNMARDPRVSCLVETGEEYFDLRGVQVKGVVRCIDDPEQVRGIGRQVLTAMAGPQRTAGPHQLAPPAAGPGAAADLPALQSYLERAARKRLGYAVEPRRVISWDHRKLLPS
jgi:PPOX class probable F420-dependent enzyme